MPVAEHGALQPPDLALQVPRLHQICSQPLPSCKYILTLKTGEREWELLKQCEWRGIKPG